MTENENVIADIEAALLGDLDLEPPQGRDEFTVRWYARKIRSGWDKARRKLERDMHDGKLTVRRHVRLTWDDTPLRGVYADVYKVVKKK